MKEYHFSGTIRKEPWEKEEIVVAAFTGNNDLGFPNNDIIKQLNHRDPDVLFFSGDRKFKSPPKALLPEADIQNGWARNRGFDAKKQADAPGAVLPGKRQLKFLRHRAEDWNRGTWMKVVLSQTTFANVATQEIVYTIRINGTKFQPAVFRDGSYAIRIIDPDKGVVKEFKRILSDKEAEPLLIKFD